MLNRSISWPSHKSSVRLNKRGRPVTSLDANANKRRVSVLDARSRATIWRHYYPEGGWGYVVVFCSCMVNVLVHGLQLSSGVLQGPVLQHLGGQPLYTGNCNYLRTESCRMFQVRCCPRISSYRHSRVMSVNLNSGAIYVHQECSDFYYEWSTAKKSMRLAIDKRN